MLLLATLGQDATNLTSMVFWLLVNQKVVGLVSGAIACLLIWRKPGSPRSQRAIVTGTVIYLAARGVLYLLNQECWDFQVYYRTGLDISHGDDPYAVYCCQYPINSLPLFVLFTFLPEKLSAVFWYVFNGLSLLCAAYLAQRIIARWQHGDQAVPWFAHAPGTLALLLAGATTWGLDAGQLTIWTSLFVYAAILALVHKRPLFSGFSLGMASLKITTSFPFLLLFFRADRWRAWIAYAAVVGGLCVCLYPPSQLPELQREHLDNVRQAREPGEINDYTFAGPFHDDMLGLEHWLYCLGLRDSTTIARLQLGILLLVGSLLFWDFRLRWNPGGELLLAALLCIYSCLFLYHRIYDGVILALPLYYCMQRATFEPAVRAAVYRTIATAFVLVLNFPRGGVMVRLADWSQHGGLTGRLFQIFLLPYCTWVLLLALFVLWLLGRQPTSKSPWPDQAFL
jgi:hypothetical protein